MQSTDIAIIGGGVAGLGVGWKLVERGFEVSVFERDTVGSGASGAAAGMLAPTAEVTFEEEELLRLGQKSLAMYPDFVDQIAKYTGSDVGYRREGTLMVALDRDDAERMARVKSYHEELGLEVEPLDADQARSYEPGLAPGVRSALYIASDHQVDAALLVSALGSTFEIAGGTLYEETSIERIEMGERVEAVVTADGERIACDKVVVAAGAWTPHIEGLDHPWVPKIRPVRGQMIALDLGEPPACSHVIRAPDAYLVPKSNGSLVIGATSEEMGFDANLTAGGLFELLRGAWETLPAIYDLNVLDTWVGFRPVTLDNAPAIGPSPVEGLWFATGHGRNGILLAPVTAVELAEAIATGEPSEVLEDFAPGRFAR